MSQLWTTFLRTSAKQMAFLSIFIKTRKISGPHLPMCLESPWMYHRHLKI